MDRKEAMRWVLWVCAHDLRRSQAKTLSYLVVGAMLAVRVSLANIGRGMPGRTSVKHKIKRVDRFLGNERIESSDAMGGLVRHLLHRHRRGFRNKPLIVSLDWVKVRGFHTLMAAMVFKGRAVPLVWGSYADKIQGKSQNVLEEGLLTLLRQMIPCHVKVIVLADRGFGRAELGRFCQSINLDYVIRICTKVWIKTRNFSGKLKDYPVGKGDCQLMRAVEYRKVHPVVQNLVIRWPAKLTDEPWYLMTSLDKKPAKISDLYARRFDIEELFRDAKDKRHGWSLRDNQITTPQRFDRLLLILAMAYLLLSALGLCCKKRYAPGRWASNNRPGECSAFFVARVMLARSSIRLRTALATLIAAIAAVGNWG
jgi:hypothetical protein